jgi:hypothetical protein
LTGAWFLQREELFYVEQQYEDLITDINGTIEEMSILKDSCDTVTSSANQAADAVGRLATVQAITGLGGDGDGAGAIVGDYYVNGKTGVTKKIIKGSKTTATL